MSSGHALPSGSFSVPPQLQLLCKSANSLFFSFCSLVRLKRKIGNDGLIESFRYGLPGVVVSSFCYLLPKVERSPVRICQGDFVFVLDLIHVAMT